MKPLFLLKSAEAKNNHKKLFIYFTLVCQHNDSFSQHCDKLTSRYVDITTTAWENACLWNVNHHVGTIPANTNLLLFNTL